MEKKYEDIKEEFWKPKNKGDAVNGILIKTQSDAGENKSMLYSIKKDAGNIVKVWGSKVLDDKMSTIAIGSDINIIYEGEVKPEKGKSYHTYRIQGLKPEGKEDIEEKEVNNNG